MNVQGSAEASSPQVYSAMVSHVGHSKLPAFPSTESPIRSDFVVSAGFGSDGARAWLPSDCATGCGQERLRSGNRECLGRVPPAFVRRIVSWLERRWRAGARARGEGNSRGRYGQHVAFHVGRGWSQSVAGRPLPLRLEWKLVVIGYMGANGAGCVFEISWNAVLGIGSGQALALALDLSGRAPSRRVCSGLLRTRTSHQHGPGSTSAERAM